MFGQNLALVLDKQKGNFLSIYSEKLYAYDQ